MILRTLKQYADYLDCSKEEVLAFFEAGLPYVEPVTDLGFISTDRMIDQWIEDLHLLRKNRPGHQPITITSTGDPIEDLRTAIERLKDDSYGKAELLAAMESTLEHLEEAAKQTNG